MHCRYSLRFFSSLFIIHRVEARQHTRVIMQGFKSLEQSMITKIIYHTDTVMWCTSPFSSWRLILIRFLLFRFLLWLFFRFFIRIVTSLAFQLLFLLLFMFFHHFWKQNRWAAGGEIENVLIQVLTFITLLWQNRQTSKMTSKKIFVTNKLTKFPLKQSNLCCGWIIKS